MTLNFCDLLVLGSDLSGLLAATLLAKRGMGVIVLQDEEREELNPNLLVGFESKLFRSLIGKLMIPDGRLQIVQKNQVSLQVILPQSRLDISSDSSLLFKELLREFPERIGFFEKLYNEIDQFRRDSLDLMIPLLPVTDKKEKKKFIKVAKSLPYRRFATYLEEAPQDATALLQAQLLFLAQGSLMDPLFFQLCFLLSPETFATFSVKGGITELKKIFYEKIEYFGGTIQKAQDGFELVVEKNEVKGIKLPQYGFVTRCRYLLGNTEVQKIYQMIPKSFRTRKFKKQAAQMKPIAYPCTLL
ncbi:MAG: hypothetical protein Q7S98_04945, partial [Deltaproteobacteria bacterium]|nr:hypothetical protein [Deltaproteobacteria bacterium]